MDEEKDLEDSHQEKGMEEEVEVEAEKPDAQLKEEKKVMSGKAPTKSADQGTEEGSSVAFCSPRAHYPDKYRNRVAVIQLLQEELRKSQLYPSGMEEDVCFPILINFMRNLTDGQWEVIQEGMRNPFPDVVAEGTSSRRSTDRSSECPLWDHRGHNSPNAG
nr:uncharacterized protein LOC115133585 isoform X4 [Oncorhynchus nerka]